MAIVLTFADIDSTALVSVPDAAAALRVKTETLRRWIRAGRVPAYGFRGAIRVRVAEVLAAMQFIPSQRKQPEMARSQALKGISKYSGPASPASADICT